MGFGCRCGCGRVRRCRGVGCYANFVLRQLDVLFCAFCFLSGCMATFLVVVVGMVVVVLVAEGMQICSNDDDDNGKEDGRET